MARKLTEREKKVTKPLSFVNLGLIIVFFLIDTDVSIAIVNMTYVQMAWFHLGLLFIWCGVLWILIILSGNFDESAKRNGLDDEDVQVSSEPKYIAEPELLLGRSDILDKVRSNLRNGISILLGISSALILWISNTTITFPLQALMMFGGACLILMAILAILFSFRSPTDRLDQISLREGLVPSEMTKTEYTRQIELVIQEKEETLSNMRTLIGVGLLLFIMVNIIAVLIPMYYPFPPTAESENWVQGMAMGSYMSSCIAMVITLLYLGSLIIGKQFLGITDASITLERSDEQFLDDREEKG